jgi:hypothetical protein
MMELKNLLNNTDRDVEDMPMSQKKALRYIPFPTYKPRTDLCTLSNPNNQNAFVF